MGCGMTPSSAHNIRIVSAPDEPHSWPTPPVYESPYPVARLQEMSYDPDPRKLYGPVVVRAISLHDVIGIVSALNQALSKSQFEVWQLRGMLKVK